MSKSRSNVQMLASGLSSAALDPRVLAGIEPLRVTASRISHDVVRLVACGPLPVGSSQPSYLRNVVRIITETGLRIYKELAPMKTDQVDLENKSSGFPIPRRRTVSRRRR